MTNEDKMRQIAELAVEKDFSWTEDFQPRNRAERRALEKAVTRQKSKRKKMYMDSIQDAAEKIAYVNLIEKVRKLREEIEEEENNKNEAATKDN